MNQLTHRFSPKEKQKFEEELARKLIQQAKNSEYEYEGQRTPLPRDEIVFLFKMIEEHPDVIDKLQLHLKDGRVMEMRMQ